MGIYPSELSKGILPPSNLKITDFGVRNRQAHHKCHILSANRVFFVLSVEKSTPMLLKTFSAPILLVNTLLYVRNRPFHALSTGKSSGDMKPVLTQSFDAVQTLATEGARWLNPCC